MRLWHYKVIKHLPRTQLLAQWRELNSIFKKEDKHILINYIYLYDKARLQYYTNLVIDEMKQRGYKINKMENYNNYFDSKKEKLIDLNYPQHDDEYLKICYYNLYEKYLRGQADLKFANICEIQRLIKGKEKWKN